MSEFTIPCTVCGNGDITIFYEADGYKALGVEAEECNNCGQLRLDDEELFTVAQNHLTETLIDEAEYLSDES